MAGAEWLRAGLFIALGWGGVATDAARAGEAPVPNQATAAVAPMTNQAAVEAQWQRFLSEATLEPVIEIYGGIDALFEDEGGVSAERCRTDAELLDRARDQVPVGLMVWYASMLCAEALGDEAEAEQHLHRFEALSAHALSEPGALGDFELPIRIVHENDAWALVGALQQSLLGFGYALEHSGRHLPFEVVLLDEDTRRERRLRFDFLDTWVRFLRDDPNAEFPLMRIALARSFVAGGAEAPGTAAHEAHRMLQAMDQHPAAARTEALLQLAEQGHLMAAESAAERCFTPAEGDCAARAFDALLPFAEQGVSNASASLAVALLQGHGVARDVDAARILLDRADDRLGAGLGTVSAASLWLRLRGEDELPDLLSRRLRRLASAGIAGADSLRVMSRQRGQAPTRLSRRDVARLRRAAESGSPALMTLFASALLARSEADAREWLERAARRAEPRAQFLLARLLQADAAQASKEGADVGAAPDPAIEHWLREAAHGGVGAASLEMGLNLLDESPARAEGWLHSAIVQGETAAAVPFAQLLVRGGQGVHGTPAEAVQVLREVLALAPDLAVQRELATLLSTGVEGVAADPAQAGRLLRENIARGDTISGRLLAAGILWRGIEAVGAEEPGALLRRAGEAGDAQAWYDLGMAMYSGLVGSPRAQEAYAALRRAAFMGLAQARNDLAWVQCTSADPDFRSAKAGLADALALGEALQGNPAFLDTLAACEAAVGSFDAAVATQQRALQLAREHGAPQAMIARFEERLAAYARQEAVHETPQRPAPAVGGDVPTDSSP